MIPVWCAYFVRSNVDCAHTAAATPWPHRYWPLRSSPIFAFGHFSGASHTHTHTSQAKESEQNARGAYVRISSGRTCSAATECECSASLCVVCLCFFEPEGFAFYFILKKPHSIEMSSSVYRPLIYACMAADVHTLLISYLD